VTTTTDTALTYRGDPDLKARLVTDMRAHREQDRLIRGDYFTEDGRGCAVGCTVADALAAEEGMPLTEWALNGRPHEWHSEWARVTGLPEWLAHLDDYLFESLPVEVSKDWPVRLLEAVPVGVDLRAAREAWLRDVVFDAEHGALASAAAGLESAGLAPEAARLRGLPPTSDWEAASDAAGAASDAAGAASDAAWAASDAARAARNAARAASNAAGAARNAAGAASNAAWAASDAARAARNAAGAASNEWVADRLIHHLTAAAQAAA
jgi:hypothetical protein